MRKIRFTTWLFLVLSLAFFCIRDFRVAAETPLMALLPEVWTGEFGAAAEAHRSREFYEIVRRSPWRLRLLDLGLDRVLERWYTLERYVSLEQFRRLAQEAEGRRDSEFLAFAALHLPEQDREAIFRLMNAAIARDVNLTWLVYPVTQRFVSSPLDAQARAALRKLQAWDPENAAPHLLLAAIIWPNRPNKARDAKPIEIAAELAKDPEWSGAMEAAFDRPRYETYAPRRLALERKVLLRQGWDHPAVAILSLEPDRIPNVLFVREYARLLVDKASAGERVPGLRDKALETYQRVARFGGRMRLQAQGRLEELIGVAIQKLAHDRLAAALRAAGRNREAAETELVYQQAVKDIERRVAEEVFSWSHYWLAFLVQLSAAVMWLFLAATIVSVAYTLVKMRFRREKQGPLHRVLTALQGYAAIFLFIASFGLYLAHEPFAQNFTQYMTQQERFLNLDALANTTLPALALSRHALREPLLRQPLGNPFVPYIFFGWPALSCSV